MRKFVLALAFISSATALQAQTRPFTPALTCAQARQIVFANGAVVLGTGTYTYDRYVRSGNFCLVGEYPEAAWVPTRDTPQCLVGYRCETDPPFFFGD
ncbi:hypothetical protein [Microvirga roseola]|uniref:hypothetical protein n=1 Tax=Microvirga roseola TaxID=2883126 RepID=UPI001E4B33ED|nr:hypothetical protein [Microvirga roseola]